MALHLSTSGTGFSFDRLLQLLRVRDSVYQALSSQGRRWDDRDAKTGAGLSPEVL